jgi:tetratricopeptide (TPR) repeat protein
VAHARPTETAWLRRDAVRRNLVLLAVAAAAVLAFVAVIPGSRFVFDDHVLIENNAYLHQSDIWWSAFARDYFATSENPGGSGYYRPIAMLTDAADVRIWARRVSGYHITNLVLHAAASLALIPVLVALGIGVTAAAITALAFAVHPAHAESVAFISGRGDLLAALWTFIALSCATSRRRGASLAFAVATLCAYLSKEVAVVLPVLMVLVWRARPRDETPAARDARAPWPLRWAVFAAVSLVALLLRYAALGRLLPASAANTPAGDGLLLPLQSFGFALASLYAPLQRLAMEPSPGMQSPAQLAAGVAIGAALWAGAWRTDPASRPGLRRAAIAAVACMVPVLNWLPQETQLSERFLYLASGFALAPFGVLVRAAWQRRPRLQPAVAGVTAILLVYAIGIAAWRARAWRDDIVLWRIATREEPARALFHNRYGLALMERGELQESEAALRRAVELDPRDAAAHHYLGMVLHRTDRPSQAIAAYQRALELQPGNLFMLLNVGLSRLAIGDTRGAYAAAQQALEIDANQFDALRFAGGCALQLGDLSAARRYLDAALRQRPNNAALIQQLQLLSRREAELQKQQ